MAPLKEVIDRWHNDFLRDDRLRKEVDRLRKDLDPQFQEKGIRCPQCNANILDNIDSWREHVASDPQHQQKLSIESEEDDAYMRIYQAIRDATVQLHEETVNVDASRNGPRRPANLPGDQGRALPQRSTDDDSTSVMIPQPETRPISQDQLVAEAKGIYAGLIMVETKCIEVDNGQFSNTESNPKLNDDQWQALVALHRTLLHEHHDFFLASQHPSASPALRRLASKYAMPARMWRHGIHSFLELLRHRLPASREHMLTFLYIAYNHISILYETVPFFEDT